MKILLLMPPQSSAIGFTDLIRAEPLGLEMVAAALSDHDVRIVDLRFKDNLEFILSHDPPDVCGIECSFTIDCYPVLKLAKRIKRISPELFVFVGGHHASMSPQDFKGGNIDAVVVGEGEVTVRELVEALEKKRDLSEIPGVLLNDPVKSGNFRPRPLIEDLDSLPFPKRAIPQGSRDGYHMGFQHPLALVETSRGCIFRCTFCSVWQFYRGTYREKSPERVVEELKQVREPFVLFVDDNFLLDVKRAKRIAQLLHDERIKKRYTFSGTQRYDRQTSRVN